MKGFISVGPCRPLQIEISKVVNGVSAFRVDFAEEYLLYLGRFKGSKSGGI